MAEPAGYHFRVQMLKPAYWGMKDVAGKMYALGEEEGGEARHWSPAIQRERVSQMSLVETKAGDLDCDSPRPQ